MSRNLRGAIGLTVFGAIAGIATGLLLAGGGAQRWDWTIVLAISGTVSGASAGLFFPIAMKSASRAFVVGYFAALPWFLTLHGLLVVLDANLSPFPWVHATIGGVAFVLMRLHFLRNPLPPEREGIG